MGTRRMLLGLAAGVAGAAAAWQAGLAQSTSGEQGGQAGGGLPDRGAPTGRTGAATRGARSADGNLTLDVVAPLRGVGLTSVDQPELCYILSGRTARPLRLAVSTPGQARPLANLELPHATAGGMGIIRLRDHGIRLMPNLLCIWSVTVALDPRAPSQDLVGSALIQYRPGDPALAAASREPIPRRAAALARAGYWYNAVTLARQGQDRDQGAALASLLKEAGLPAAADPAAALVR
jgi:hypothetical protein